jgi:hypothetical protein
MGAFVITYPHDWIRTLLFFGWFARVTLIPALLLIGFWFLTQLFSAVGGLADLQTGGVAYMAHVGGFWYMAYRRTGGAAGGMGSIFGVGKSKATEVKPEDVGVTFKDVGGAAALHFWTGYCSTVAESPLSR